MGLCHDIQPQFLGVIIVPFVTVKGHNCSISIVSSEYWWYKPWTLWLSWTGLSISIYSEVGCWTWGCNTIQQSFDWRKLTNENVLQASNMFVLFRRCLRDIYPNTRGSPTITALPLHVVPNSFIRGNRWIFTPKNSKWDHSSCNYLVILNIIYVYYNILYIYHDNPLITVKGYLSCNKNIQKRGTSHPIIPILHDANFALQ